MLISLKLKNFKKHEDLCINFTEGLNAIRGDNEKGKSTIVHAIGYAYYGARALPLSLDETVTWGKPVGSLKVELVFLHDGEMYTLTRSKSGAELVGTSVQSSGQTEVTAFIERLFGATAAVGQATLLTNQSALQAGLDSSSTALIEKLANMSLIDELVSKIQDQLPTGSTKLLEARLNEALEVTKPDPLDETLNEEAEELREIAEACKAKVEKLELEEKRLKPLADEVQAKLRDNEATAARVAKLQSDLAKLPKTIEIPQAPDLVALEAAALKQAEQSKLRAAWEKFSAIPYQDEDHGTSDDFVNAYGRVTKQIQELKAKKQTLQIELAGLKPLLITETICGLCDKDLSKVPEVITKNKKTQDKIDAVCSDITYIENELAFKQSVHNSYKSIGSKYDEVEALVGIDFVKFDMNVVPPKATWVGGLLESEVDMNDYVTLVKQAKNALAAIQKAREKAARLESERALLEKQIREAILKEITGEDDRWLLDLAKVRRELNSAIHDSKITQASAVRAEGEAYKAKVDCEARVKTYQAALAMQEDLKQDIAEYGKNNALIKRLREVRPAVAKKLWSIVLAAVSHYFSAVRGVQSVVGREGSGFTIDGKVVEAYSGSTRDALALAMRVVLQKTFLPSIDFALFDEVASACDDSRESEMLAMLSTCGLKQVLLVTHSDLADSYAANVIRI